MPYDMRTDWHGVLAQHAAGCPARLGDPCTCGPLGYRGTVTDPDRSEPVLGPVRSTVEGARAWRSEHEAAMDSWQAAASRGDTVEDVVEDFLDSARAGRALDGDGRPYDPDTLGDLRWALQGYVAGELGAMRIADVRGTELRRLVRRLEAGGLSAARMRSIVAAVRALLRYAAQRGMVSRSAADTLILGDESSAPPPRRPERDDDEPRPRRRRPDPDDDDDHDDDRPAPPRATAPPGYVSDDVIWLVLKVVAVAFVLIALVLAAESV
jgi:hypothetical protein